MGYAVRVSENYAWIVNCYVEEGQAIVPGAPIFELMGPEGVVETVTSDCWGIVAHVEEAANDSVFPEGAVLCHIAKRNDRQQRGAALTPRPAPALRLRRLMGLAT